MTIEHYGSHPMDVTTYLLESASRLGRTSDSILARRQVTNNYVQVNHNYPAANNKFSFHHKPTGVQVGVELSDQELNALCSDIGDVLTAAIRWIGKQTVDYIKENPWKCLAAAAIGATLGYFVVFPGAVALGGILAGIGVSTAVATTVGSCIIGAAGAFALLRLVLKLVESIVDCIKNGSKPSEKLLNQMGDAITTDTEEMADNFLGRGAVSAPIAFGM